jgi:hypothetical protein
MDREFTMRRGVAVALALVAAVAIGAVAYQAGFSHGLAVQAPAGAAFRDYGPWRFGFVGPLVSLFVFFFILRTLMFALFGWGWGWRRRLWRDPRYRDSEYGPYGFDEWHRRAHERMRDDRAAAPPTT